MNILEKIISKVKIIFKKVKIKKEEKILQDEQSKLEKILSSIEIGDIILAKRYKQEKEKETIAEGHQNGPYIVVGKTKDGLICSAGKSAIPNAFKVDDYFKIKLEDYKLDKDTYFKLINLELIDDYSFIYKIDNLNSEDKETFLRNIKYRSNHNYIMDGVKKPFAIEIHMGDIISVNGTNYIIIKEESDRFGCIKLKTGRTKLKIEDMKNLNYLNIVEFDKKEDIKYLATISPNLLIYSLKRQREYIENYNNRTIPQRGSVIAKNRQLYYIYGEEQENWLIFKISRNYSHLMDEINIKSHKFYTIYETDKINKKDKFQTILLALEDQINSIKMCKKIYKKRLEEASKEEQKAKARSRKK